jgi:hypothetical protein
MRVQSPKPGNPSAPLQLGIFGGLSTLCQLRISRSRIEL